ncbi:MAG TPA: hypothetical protein VEP73_09640, partial [Actinomycetota bacterium]|nr:hypothetical protein [Actinomycetota bacterium]
MTGLDELRATPQDEQVWQDVVVVVAVYAVLAGWTVAGVPQRTVENASFVGAVLGGALYAALRVQARESG